LRVSNTLSPIAEAKTFKHWAAILFFAASLVVLYFLSNHFYDPCARRFEPIEPAIWSGDEPHYLITISSILRDGDLSLGNNYESVRLGGADAGRSVKGINLDHHTLIRDTRTGQGLLWTQIFAPGTPVECAPGDVSCVGYQRVSEQFPDYTPTSLQYRELPQHPVPFAALLAMLLKISGPGINQVESRALYLQVFLSWLAGVITYLCALKVSLGSKSCLGVVSLVYFASPWPVYSHELYPATFMGLLLIVALWAFVCRRFILAAVFLAIACMQSEAFIPIFPAWVVLLYLSGERKAAWIFSAAGVVSLLGASLFSYALLGKVTLRHMWFTLTLAPWRTLFEPESGLLFFVPWSAVALCFLILSFSYRRNSASQVLRVIAAGIFPVAAVYMILPNTGGFSYGPRYWVPYMPWLALAFVLGIKNYPRARSILVTPILIILVGLSIVITVSAAILKPSATPFLSEPPWFASTVLWHNFHRTDIDASCPRGDLQFWLGSDCNNTDRQSARLTLRVPVHSTSFAIVSRLACSAPIPDGAEVMRLRFYDVDGSIQTRSIVAGHDSSEWAYDCTSVRPGMRHGRADIFANYSSKLPDGRCEGHFYFTKYALDGVKEVKAIDFEWVGGPGGIILDKLSLIDEKAKSLYPIDAALLGP
jgi:hypothetical protein